MYTPLASRGWANRIRLPSIKDDAVALGGLEKLDQLVMVGGGRLTDELDRRRPQARGGEQHVMLRGIQAADPGPDQLSQRRGQYFTRAVNERASQFDGIERISG